ncbi:Gfo/Idh/MocA family protein [Rubrobacter calidifluminis]|uniref:Gfo/Idh/MocA family protein n=1 Tax=Rubrobacter calidifluminis TaxID=1392640 RepID=UPI0023607DB3|nr:Gfo/Idh/MocA family oxidoreductase [Rubrobacter calidifluminis]
MRKLKMGMVGGGAGSLIGAVHRSAALMDGQIELVAGALSSTKEKAFASGQEIGLPEERIYATWQEMLEGELSLPEKERVDFISVVTPNNLHFPVAKAFVEAGFNVVVDKPMVHTSEQAQKLVEAVEEREIVFCVTYNYTGYPMVKQARYMVRRGDLGEVRKVIVEYSQGWLAGDVEENNKQARWRTDPEIAGIAGAMGDIGSHAENLVSTITGLEVSEICADLTTFVEGRRLDDDANLLIRYKGGARGVLIASQVAAGEENALSIKVYGTEGGLRWNQEEPNCLIFKPSGAPTQVLKRGNDYLCKAAKGVTRLPPGHPEAFIEAFANVYSGVAEAIRARREGRTLEGDAEFPTVYDGARGVRFIEKAVESGMSEKKWVGFS